MKIPVLIEATSEHRFRARGGEPFLVDVEAETPAAALAKVRNAIKERVAGGASIVELEVSQGNPWLAGAGMFRDDLLFDDWQRAVSEYRRKANEQSDVP